MGQKESQLINKGWLGPKEYRLINRGSWWDKMSVSSLTEGVGWSKGEPDH